MRSQIGEPKQKVSKLTAFNTKLDPSIHIICPDGFWPLTVEHGEDSSGQVDLAGSLG